MSDFTEILKNFGVAVAVLFALLIAIWRIAVWLKPWLEKLFTAHLSLVNAISQTQEKHTDSLQKIAEGQTQIVASQSQMASSQLQQTILIREVKELVATDRKILKDAEQAKGGDGK